MVSILLDADDIAKLEKATRDDIFKLVGIGKSVPDNLLEDDLPELPIALVRKLVAGLSDKTLGVLKEIASKGKVEESSATFRMSELIKATNGAESYLDLSGVWTALTKRTRKIYSDPEAYLIRWDSPTYENDEYADQVGHISLMTYRSLKKHFSL